MLQIVTTAKQWLKRNLSMNIVFVFAVLLFVGCSGDKYTPEKEGLSQGKETDNEPAIEDTAVSRQDILLPNAEADIIDADWSGYFDGMNGAAVIYDPAKNRYLIYNRELANTKRPPCSTFKIISSLIGLEYNIIIPDDSIKEWSGEIFWNDNWNKDIDFSEAFRTSCVWYFREVIDEIGEATIKTELENLHYGNCDISDWEGRLNTNNDNRALTGFWIESSLKISPKEQTEVMERIFGSQSAYSDQTLELLKQVMCNPEQAETDIMVYGKTGMGKDNGITVDAWYTGFADINNERIYFCVYLGESQGQDVTSTKAKEIAIKILNNVKNVEERIRP